MSSQNTSEPEHTEAGATGVAPVQSTSFGAVLKRLRLAAGLTQAALAERAGVSAKTVSDLERQPRRGPRLETVRLLADALGLDQPERAQLLAAARPESLSPDVLAAAERPEPAPPHPPASPVGNSSVADAAAEVRGAPLVGRTQELARIRRLLLDGTAWLLTLTGPAGVGKTRLAREVAQRFAAAFPGGSWFVDLTAVRDPAEVPAILARSLGLPDAGATPPLEQVSAYLQDRQALLILDNVDQVLAAAPLLDALLVKAPGLRMLVTSREPLHLRVEQILRVPPLALPDARHLPPLAELAQVPSVALFLQRARMLNPGFGLTAENAWAVAELVVRLDGLPLAIELAAARTPLLSPQMLLDRLAHRLCLLHWQAQDLPQRQQTLRAAIAWSYDLLTPEEQALFRCLGVFVGGFTLEAAEAILSAAQGQAVEVIEGLASLVDKSLVLAEGDGGRRYRYRLLESMREYAREQTTSRDEAEALRRAHARYFLALAERAAPELVGPGQRAWFLRLEQEHQNLWAALRWSWDRGENEQALRLVAALAYFLESRGYLREGMRALEEALARVTDADPRLRARILNRLGSLLTLQGEAERSRAVLEEALALGRAAHDADATTESLTYLGRRAEAVGASRESLQAATQVLEEALALQEQRGSRSGTAYVQLELAWVAFAERRYRQADRLAHAALTTYQEISDDREATAALLVLGAVAGAQGETSRAVALLRRGLEVVGRLQDRHLLLLATMLIVWWLAGGLGDAEQSAILFGAADALAEAAGPQPIGWRQARLSDAATALETRLGATRFAEARGKGRSLSFSQISAVVARVLAEAEAAHGGPEPSGG